MEARTRRSIPHAGKPHGALRTCRQWRAAVRHGWCHAKSALYGCSTEVPWAHSATTVFALLGFLSPSNRGSLATVMIVCWTFFGGYGTPTCHSRAGADAVIPAGSPDTSQVGYTRPSAERTNGVIRSLPPRSCRRMFDHVFSDSVRVLNGSHRFVFAVVFLLNLFLIAAGSSGAVPFGEYHRERSPSSVLSVTPASHRYHPAGHHSLVRHLRTAVRCRLVLWVETRCKRFSMRLPALRD